jgi:hypothetical protein
MEQHGMGWNLYKSTRQSFLECFFPWRWYASMAVASHLSSYGVDSHGHSYADVPGKPNKCYFFLETTIALL